MSQRVFVLVVCVLALLGTINPAAASGSGGRGDCNFDSYPYEIADAVTFLNFFQCAAHPTVAPCTQNLPDSTFDINADGVAFTVADVVFLIRVIMGDVEPIPDGGSAAPIQGLGIPNRDADLGWVR